MPVAVIPASYMDLFEKKAYGSLATIMPDGTPQVTPVWVDHVDGFLLVNSARGRQKVRNARRNPNVALAIIDPDNAYRYLSIRWRVVELDEAGAAEHIDKMSLKYRSDHYRGWTPGMVRILIKIEPLIVSGHG